MIDKTRRKYGTLLLVLLLWVLLFTGLSVLFPDSILLVFLQPFSVFDAFLHLWLEGSQNLMLLLALLPLAGWLLLSKNKEAGRPMIYIPQWLLLASACIITPLHLFNGFGYINATGARAGSSLGLTLLSGLPAVVYPVVVLIFTSKWKPYIK